MCVIGTKSEEQVVCESFRPQNREGPGCCVCSIGESLSCRQVVTHLFFELERENNVKTLITPNINSNVE